jgi:hypothetical protein
MRELISGSLILTLTFIGIVAALFGIPIWIGVQMLLQNG